MEKERMQAVPEVGNKHSFFDDGKMRESRHYFAEVLRLTYSHH